MRAVASLARPSPSSTTRSRRGSPKRRAMASGATTSGGATMAPSTKATASGMPSSQCAAAVTAQVVNTTQPNANSVIGRRLKRNSRQLMATAGRIDERRQDAEQNQFGRQLDARQAGRERQTHAGDDEKNGGSDVEPPRGNGN